jgi:hypothetical protein
MAKQGVLLLMSDIFGVDGRKAIDELSLDPPFLARVLSLLRLIDAYTFEIDVVAKRVTGHLARDRGFMATQAIPGVGPALGTIFVAEIGDVHRFPNAAKLCSWAGMTPLHRESDAKVHRGRITKQGNNLVRWAAVEAVQKVHHGPIAADLRRARQRPMPATRSSSLALPAPSRKRCDASTSATKPWPNWKSWSAMTMTWLRNPLDSSTACGASPW